MNMSPHLASSDPGGVFFALIFVGIMFWFVYSLFKSSTRKENLEAAARRFQGTVIPSFWSADRLAFAVDGVPAELTFKPGSKNRSSFTRVRFRHVPCGYLRISPEGLFTWLRKMFGVQDIEVGDRAFDQAFLVQGSPEAWVREVLDSEARRRIDVLATMAAYSWGRSHVAIEAGPGGVTIFCYRNFVDNRDELETFLDQSVALFRQIRVPAVEGIKILSAEEHVGRGECPVCASPIEGSARRCGSCGTSHHGDCWQYFGGCAIYGCAARGGRPS